MRRNVFIAINPRCVSPETTHIFYTRKEAETAGKNYVIVEKIVDFDSKTANSPVFTTCYGKRTEWKSAEDAINFYREGADCSDGCERERYLNIVMKLMDGETDVDDQR